MADGFGWDEAKAAANLRKHGVSFTEAIAVFEDQNALVFIDNVSDPEEQRFILIGLSFTARVLCVVYVPRRDNTRIISARKATLSEEKEYFSNE